MPETSRMALLVLSDADDRLEEAATFVASAAAMDMAVRVLVAGRALARVLGGGLPPAAAARLAEARALGDVRLFACSAALRRAGATRESALEREPRLFDDVVGVPAFLAEHLSGAEVQLVF